MLFRSNTTGSYNTAIGWTALISNTDQSNNTAVGSSALTNNTSGFDNTAIGRAALAQDTSGGDNTAVGAYAPANDTTGQQNTVLGQSAASNNVTGSYNTFIGMNAGPTADGINFATAIGYAASVTKSNTIVLGGTGGPGYPTVGIGTNSPNTAYILDVHGNLNVTGAITAGTKDFKIDDPIDPAKDLYHASVESSEMKNLYDGVATLDGKGRAVVRLPNWFEALNAEFRYQLTAIGRPAPGLYIAREVHSNQFEIAGGKPGMKVSWTVTGVRHDDWAKAHPLHVEELKSQGDISAASDWRPSKPSGANGPQ